MTDILDDASKVEELHLGIALKHRNPIYTPCGACFNCSEPIEKGLFCSKDCGEDFELRERTKKREGKL